MVGTGDPTTINDSPMVRYSNANIELGKTGLRYSKTNTEYLTKDTIQSKFTSNVQI